VRVGVSIGDSIAGLYAAFGIMAALWQRDRVAGDGRARTLDVALTESVLSMMEGVLPEYGAFGAVREPVGARIASAAPSSAYPTRDGSWILIAANSEPLFARLCDLMGQHDLSSDPRFTGNRNRVANVEALDALIGEWTRRYDSKEVDRILAEADIPATLVYTAAEIAADPQFRERGMVREVEDPAIGRVLQAGIVPHVPDDPGQIRWAGPALGAHTDEVMGEMLGFGRAEIQALRDEGVL
jgi:formyl-CoA transferase